MHARKMCAALRAATSAPLAEPPILFRLETGVGHGARATSRTAGLAADQLAFLARYLGETTFAGEGEDDGVDIGPDS